MDDISPLRIRTVNAAPVNASGRHVVYWMVTQRRLGWNFALERAANHARTLGLPLIILEALRCDHPWSSPRHHAFALDGMREHAARLKESAVAYHPYVEPAPGAGKGLLEALARDAAVVVTDEYPTFFVPSMVAAAGRRLGVALEAVDSNGLLPMAATPGPHTAAYHFRRFLQKTLAPHLLELPHPDPLAEAPLAPGTVPGAILDKWPRASEALLSNRRDALDGIPFLHDVPPSDIPGGEAAARRRLRDFLQRDLPRYGEERNHPDDGAASGLSPYLHWGHLSTHEVFREVAKAEGWSPARLSSRTDGKRHGWWGMSPAAESFLDELVTWRELGFAFCHHVPDHDRYDGLPEWALETLADHEDDPRPWCYTLEDFDQARTHDPLWNAAQRELRHRGVIHNYLRMLWGKKILEWSRTPREALGIMVELNNRYALDGRDPNSYSGIFWVLGRFDRGWPERPIYGKVRSMSSDNTRKKVRVDRYLDTWGPQPGLGL